MATTATTLDTLRGLRRFLEGVLDLWNGGDKETISAGELKALLAEIKDASEDPKYWEEMMQALPGEGGLGLAEVAEDILKRLNEANTTLAFKDTLRGMRRFLDGVLDLWRSGSKDAVSAVELKALLAEIRDASDDPKYWEEVMQAVPCEGGFGLSLAEVAEVGSGQVMRGAPAVQTYSQRIRFIRSPAPVRMSMLLALWITSVAALEMGQQFPRHDVLDGYDNMLSVMVFPASEQQAAELDKAFKTVAGARDEFHVHGANVSFWGEPALLEYAHYGGQLRAEDAGLSPTGLAALISVTDNFTVEKVWEQTAARGLAQQTLDFILKTYHAEKEEQEAEANCNFMFFSCQQYDRRTLESRYLALLAGPVQPRTDVVREEEEEDEEEEEEEEETEAHA
ncbi:unnamed protein product [Symbiodinium natans]|uniref:Uncharacterized protein n=1 Tax=Symbiodinium natans TaxID=878477 RepID=A0A812P472_9DINO|nr:unnamed protein product [Symbiodinium natans]